MKKWTGILVLLLAGWAVAGNQARGAAPSPVDSLGRMNPRSTVTAFLQACHQENYVRAAQYLDLSRLPERQRTIDGPKISRELEALLNSASRFDVLQMSQDPLGRQEDDADPSIEHVTAVSVKTVGNQNQSLTLDLERKQPVNGPAIWLFEAGTVAKIPQLVPSASAESEIEARLPRFAVTTVLLETPLWKWIALLLAAVLLLIVFRLLVRVFNVLMKRITTFYPAVGATHWLEAIVDPLLVLLIAILFRIIEEIIAPAALTRIYIGRALLLVTVGSFAWGLINLLDYLVVRLDGKLNQERRVVSHAVIYLGRRTLKAVIAVFAAILILDNWGFDMTTIIAGLGVGGIAVALAAQQTIANVFGGVSVIGDAPVNVGDFGNFGGVIGTVEDIGLRSARVRTLNRSIMSIPNSAFSGMNLENYTVRDKILFNPGFAVKRTTPKDKLRQLIKDLGNMLKQHTEIGPTPVRITGYSAASFTIEVFVYVRTVDLDDYYRQQAELYMAIDEVVSALAIELA